MSDNSEDIDIEYKQKNNNGNQDNQDQEQNKNIDSDIEDSQEEQDNQQQENNQQINYQNQEENDTQENNDYQDQQEQQQQKIQDQDQYQQNSNEDYNKEQNTSNSQDYNKQKQFQTQKSNISTQNQSQNNINIDNQNPVFGQFSLGAIIAHLIFKILAIVSYQIFPIITEEITFDLIFVMLFTAFDFWTVKNVTGRLLVGLRYYSEIQEDGKEIWLYESQTANFKPNQVNAQVFWLGQLAIILYWLFIFLFNLFTLDIAWAFFALFPFIISGINFRFYYNCRGEHQQKAANLKNYVARKGVQKALQQ